MTSSSSSNSNSNSNRGTTSTSNSDGGGGSTLRQRKNGSNNANANATTTTASSDDSDDIIPNKKPTTTSKLYQRLESSSSITSIVEDDEKNNKNGKYLKEITKIPGYSNNTNNNGNGSNNNGSGNNNNSNNNSIRKVLSGNEKNGSKILIRAISGLTLIVFFLICIYLGHLYVCLLVALSEILLFRELVKVRYNTYFESRIQDTIPLFRTTQWMWFIIAIFYTYSEFIMQVIDNNPNLYYLIKYTNPYLYIIIFTLYSCTFVMTIVTLKVGHIKFQLNQLCWTIVVLCLTVGQMKYIMHNIFNGLFWFTFPFLCVVCNDVMAYFCGISCGRKFIHRKFMSVSPNKTWEGFIGTSIMGFFV
jgi:CDP-diglyceride synthetase